MNTTEIRERLLAGIAVRERRLDLAGVSTAVLEGGPDDRPDDRPGGGDGAADGAADSAADSAAEGAAEGAAPPLVLLHGPGEFAASWLPVLPQLARVHHVVAPDLPGHGASPAGAAALTVERTLRWLDELVARTCPQPPVLVGRVVGGAIAARYAARPGTGRRPLAGLVLVDSAGLTPFDPDPRFGIALHRHVAAPTQQSFERLMEFCAFDVDRIRDRWGERWDHLVAYAVALAHDPAGQAAATALIAHFAATPIPPEELAAIAVPTALIWGRHDLATPTAVAEAASRRYGWPLHVVEAAGDDPPLDRPEEFLAALRAALPPVGAATGMAS